MTRINLSFRKVYKFLDHLRIFERPPHCPSVFVFVSHEIIYIVSQLVIGLRWRCLCQNAVEKCVVCFRTHDLWFVLFTQKCMTLCVCKQTWWRKLNPLVFSDFYENSNRAASYALIKCSTFHWYITYWKYLYMDLYGSSWCNCCRGTRSKSS